MITPFHTQFIGKKFEHGGKVWRVASVRESVRDHHWAWIVNVKKPMDQARLSLKALDISNMT